MTTTPYMPRTRALAEGEIRYQESLADLADASAAARSSKRAVAKYKGDARRHRREATRLRELLPNLTE